MLRFDTCTFHELALTNGFGAFVCEYRDETANPAIGEAGPQMEKYYELDKEGRLHVIRVCDDDHLAGAAVLLVTPSQHYPFPLVGVDSIYLRKPWRKGGTGLRLLAMIKGQAQALGAPGFPIMAPPESPLDKLCKLKGFSHTHNCYWVSADE